MNDILNYIVNNGIGVVCVAYLIYFQSTTMKEMLDTMKSIDSRLTVIETEAGIKQKNKESK